MPLDSLLTILGMAFATYATRAGGLWIMGHVPLTPRIQAWIRYIPGAVLVSIVTPIALTNGPADVLATVVTVFVAARTKSLLLTMGISVAVAWLLRNLI